MSNPHDPRWVQFDAWVRAYERALDADHRTAWRRNGLSAPPDRLYEPTTPLSLPSEDQRTQPCPAGYLDHTASQCTRERHPRHWTARFRHPNR